MNNICPVCGSELIIKTDNAYCENCKAQFKNGNITGLTIELIKESKDEV
jgi:uncharacterized Zn finger protein (UPF0148 family)